MSEGVPVSATDNALDRIETAISLAFEGEGEAWSDRLSGDRLAHSARRAIEDIWDGLVAAERAKARQDAEKVILEAWQVIDHNCEAYKILSAALRSREVQ